MQEFPIVSKLDPAVYGPPESALTKEILEKQMNGLMTVEQVRSNDQELVKLMINDRKKISSCGVLKQMLKP